MQVWAGAFRNIYNPSDQKEAWYINDHTIIRGTDGWHLFGITHKEPADPLDEKLCAHAVSSDFPHGRFCRLPPAFAADPAYGEAHFWAPHVIRHDGRYHMFYCAGSLEGHDRYQIMMAESEDLYHWERFRENPLVVDGFDARDPMVIREGGRWLLYYTCTTAPEGGNHCVAVLESEDLHHWVKLGNVFVDAMVGTYAGPCESPFVLKKKDWFFLFLSLRGGYVGTDVFASRDPLDFSEQRLVGHIDAHAAEVIEVGDQLYITHCGWGQGGVFLAPLQIEW
ncbi:MAG: glycosyl hydrolase family 32 [Candidatus Howiella sp.]|jgi:arabinan endo-1,5-alpha-L-arabinosidase